MCRAQPWQGGRAASRGVGEAVLADEKEPLAS